ncbi:MULTISPECIES: NADPH-dependent F420 reductase [Pseudomonas]|uniref:NADPH-dependent F420 reductase n=1 Tax=Pseudomonas TaxID=286 RepID=UPI0037FF340C
MKIGILGAGRMGGNIGTVLARAGHAVVFSYSRSASRLQALARNAGPGAKAGTVHEAAQADVVLLAVHWSRLDDVLAQAGTLAGKVVLTCCVPLNEADTELVVAHQQSGAEVLARRLPQALVVATFQTTPSEVLLPVYERREQAVRPNLLYCSDEPAARRVAVALISDAGFAPEDAGPLRIARYIEPFAMLTAQLAYGGRSGPELTYRFERY